MQPSVHARHLEPLADNSLDELSEPQIADAMTLIISPSKVKGKPFEVVAMGSDAQDESIVMAEVSLDAPATEALPTGEEVAAHAHAMGAAASLTGGQKIKPAAQAKTKVADASKVPRSTGGGRPCEHNRQKNQCKECRGSQVCSHGKRKSLCKECGGGAYCVHGRRKNRCKECGGSGICVHGREKYSCKECGGSGICVHGRRKYICKECVPR